MEVGLSCCSVRQRRGFVQCIQMLFTWTCGGTGRTYCEMVALTLMRAARLRTLSPAWLDTTHMSLTATIRCPGLAGFYSELGYTLMESRRSQRLKMVNLGQEAVRTFGG